MFTRMYLIQKITNPNDVIVPIGGAGVSRTDLHVIEGIWRDHSDLTLPHILGHENAMFYKHNGMIPELTVRGGVKMS